MMTYTKNTGCSYTQSRLPKGFTLIELLVVVLIIGILTAVALPQYRIAVEKSKAMGTIQQVKALGQAQQFYFLENGNYARSFGEVGIEIPGLDAKRGHMITSSNVLFSFRKTWESTYPYIYGMRNPSEAGFPLSDQYRIAYDLNTGTLYCVPFNYLTWAGKVCTSLSHSHNYIICPWDAGQRCVPL